MAFLFDHQKTFISEVGCWCDKAIQVSAGFPGDLNGFRVCQQALYSSW